MRFVYWFLFGFGGLICGGCLFDFGLMVCLLIWVLYYNFPGLILWVCFVLLLDCFWLFILISGWVLVMVFLSCGFFDWILLVVIGLGLVSVGLFGYV